MSQAVTIKHIKREHLRLYSGGESLVKCPNCGAGMKLDTLGINICPKGHGYFVPASIIGIHDLEEAVRNANPK